MLVDAGVVHGGGAGVFEARGGPDLAEEAGPVALLCVEQFQRIGAVAGDVAGGLAEHLDRDRTVEALVVAVVDLAHPAPAEQRVDPVAPAEQPLRRHRSASGCSISVRARRSSHSWTAARSASAARRRSSNSA